MDGPRIEMEANGPYLVYGPAVIVDADGHERHVEVGHSVKLCRCGHDDRSRSGAALVGTARPPGRGGQDGRAPGWCVAELLADLKTKKAKT
jgi:Iron-binding zinc finger CDGSH type